MLLAAAAVLAVAIPVLVARPGLAPPHPAAPTPRVSAGTPDADRIRRDVRLPIFSIASNAAGRADTGLGLRRDWVGASDPTFTPGDRVTAALNAAMGRRTATAEQFLPWEGVRITEPAHSVASTMSVTANEPLTLRGEASVHEGTVQWRVTNSTREVVASGVTSASVGAPGRGTLEFTIKGLPAGRSTIRAFSSSMAEGRGDLADDTVAITVG
jgi:hypothetical protein